MAYLTIVRNIGAKPYTTMYHSKGDTPIEYQGGPRSQTMVTEQALWGWDRFGVWIRVAPRLDPAGKSMVVIPWATIWEITEDSGPADPAF